MLKVVLDTSILVSAFLKHAGVNARVLQQARDHYQVYLSEEILEETSQEVIRRSVQVAKLPQDNPEKK